MPRDVHDWTRDKLKILSDYLPVYLTATTGAIDRVFIDAFSGPGKNRVLESGEVVDGSPLIALNARSQNGSQFTELYFIEKSLEDADELEEEIAARGDSVRAKVIRGDTNMRLPEVVQGLHKRAPTFVFLDTEGIEPRWSTIEAIAPWRTELLINFPLGMAINRNVDSPKTNDYFGTPNWREVWEGMSPEQDKPLLNFYKDRLKSLGYSHTIDDDCLIKTREGQKLYYLVFVTKFERATEIMSWVRQRPNASGQSRMDL